MFKKLTPMIALIGLACTNSSTAIIKNIETSISNTSPAICAENTYSIIAGIQTENGTVKLNICTDYGEIAYIDQLILRLPEKNDVVYNKSTVVKQEKIAPALFGSVIDLNVELEKDGKKAFISGDNERNWKFVFPDATIIGQLVHGDPFEKCFNSYGNQYITKDLTLGSAKVKMHLCVGGIGTSGTYTYGVVGVDIVDNNINLIQPIDVQLTGAALKEKITERKNHHNVCDSLVIKLPGVIYGITSLGGVGLADECTLLPDTPSVNNSKVGKYKVTYFEKVIEGNLNSPNYFD